MYCFLCEDSIDGIFTGVYDAWASRLGHKNIRLCSREIWNYELGWEYIEVSVDSEKSRKVAETIKRRLGIQVYEQLCQAMLASDLEKKKKMDKADCVYRTLLLGFSLEKPERVMEALGEPYINYLFCLGRATAQEAHHLSGFLRFAELENGVLLAKIHPKNDALEILAEHFTDRLPMENFIIYDENRKKAAVHKEGSGFVIVKEIPLDEKVASSYSENELEYQKLWCGFFESIAIESRKNPALQSQNIPKRFWKDTVELRQ